MLLLQTMMRLHLRNEFVISCGNLRVTPEKLRCNVKSHILAPRREKYKIVATERHR